MWENYNSILYNADALFLDKIDNSDGIVFASPNYSFHVSGQMKIFLDRFGFLFHRPCFFGKVSTSIVVQGFYAGEKISRYFNFLENGLGFNVVDGRCLTMLDPMTAKDKKKIDMVLKKQSRTFYSKLTGKKYPSPSVFKLMIFRMSRTSINLLLDESNRDYAYYKKNGWFESEYYYPVQLCLFKRLFGKLFDSVFYSIYKKKKLADVKELIIKL